MAERGLATAEDVAWAATIARERGRLGIDTEFMSEGRYHALLCLAQVVVDGDDGEARILMIDALDRIDPSPLAEVLADPAVEVVLHAGRQDVAILRRTWNTELNNIFDTQIAAGFAGASAQAGYANLLGAILGRRVGKTASYTRWDARPLTAEQLSYAAEDVAHLLELADELQAPPHRQRPAGVGARGMPAAGGRHRRARPRHGLGAPAARQPARPSVAGRRARARRLARAHRDRRGPARRLGARRSPARRAGQAPAVEPARARADSRHPPVRAQAPRPRDRRGDRARPRGAPDPARARRERSEPGDAPLISLAEAVLRARALEAGLAYELLASRSELEQIVGAARRAEPEPDVRTLTGWRRELVGG